MKRKREKLLCRGMAAARLMGLFGWKRWKETDDYFLLSSSGEIYIEKKKSNLQVEFNRSALMMARSSEFNYTLLNT